MALLSIQSFPNGGSPTFAAAAGAGDTILAIGGRGGGWDLGVALVVRNAGSTAKTVTVEGVPPVNVPAGVLNVDPAIDVNAVAIVPIPAKHFGVARAVTYSAVTDLTVAAVRLSG